ncbi:hypothetical protein C8F04DRAFT_1306139 [Mycena alexandri]|uniref:Uncharacterized protein n=1 Tax=Mycena alexandri TaxID=1745969 RepID=A0AAD6SCU0_9AGAR|nr:hypothetical protein C8F04DRAFT_1306139 [Mycena alexandri]
MRPAPLCRAALILQLAWSPAARANSFLSDSLLRKNPVHNVLDHQPARNVDCKNSIVRPRSMPPCKVITKSNGAEADRPDRDDPLRLRDRREKTATPPNLAALKRVREIPIASGPLWLTSISRRFNHTTPTPSALSLALPIGPAPPASTAMKKRHNSSCPVSLGTFPAHITHSERCAGGLGWYERHSRTTAPAPATAAQPLRRALHLPHLALLLRLRQLPLRAPPRRGHRALQRRAPPPARPPVSAARVSRAARPASPLQIQSRRQIHAGILLRHDDSQDRGPADPNAAMVKCGAYCHATTYGPLRVELLECAVEGCTGVCGVCERAGVEEGVGGVRAQAQPFEPHWDALSTVDLSNRRLESTARLKEFLPALDALNLNANQLSWLRELDLAVEGGRGALRWTRLEMLNVSGNRLERVVGLAGLQALVALNVDDNLLGTLDAGGAMPRLRILRASGNRLRGLDVHWFAGLRTLYADGNLLEGDALHALAPLDAKKTVGRAAGREGKGGALGRLENLSLRNQGGRGPRLDFADAETHVCNALPASFLSAACYNLVYLELVNCRLAMLPPGLVKLTPNLRALNLNYNFLEDVRGLEGLSRLRKLSVVGARLKGTKDIIRVVRGLPEVERIAEMLARSDSSELDSDSPTKGGGAARASGSGSGSGTSIAPSTPASASASSSRRTFSRSHAQRSGGGGNANGMFLTECSFGVAHDQLVEVLTDVEPFEPHWDALSTVDLSN